VSRSGGQGVSRRRFLIEAAGLVGAAGAAGCAKAAAREFACTDTGGLAAEDVTARVNAGYTDHAPDPARACERCQQYMGSSDGCGACKLVRGPIHPKGTCKVFTAKG